MERALQAAGIVERDETNDVLGVWSYPGVDALTEQVRGPTCQMPALWLSLWLPTSLLAWPSVPIICPYRRPVYKAGCLSDPITCPCVSAPLALAVSLCLSVCLSLWLPTFPC
jgi:hypothetical protein